MPAPLLRGAAEASAAHGLFDASVISHAVMSNLGNSSALAHPKVTGPTSYGEWTFPVIPFGVPTTIIPVAFPLTRAPTKTTVLMQEQVQLCVVFFVALLVWMLPTMCINKRLCCQCFRRWISKRLGCYFILGVFLNVAIISIVIQKAHHIEANSLFFTGVTLLEKLTDQMEKVLMQLLGVFALIVLYLFRKKIFTILGFDQQVVKAELRDILTGFSMKRFRAIEVSLWHCNGLPTSSLGSRTLFTRMTLGYNEAGHTRPHDKVQSTYTIKERLCVNYDPEDDTQRMSIVVKMQEVIGATVNQLLPAAGAIVGAVGGMASPLGPSVGLVAGTAIGTGAANSVGAEIARVDLSAAMINRMRERFQNDSAPNPNSERPSSRAKTGPTSTGPAVQWNREYFQKVDMIPQGELWLRIADIDE